MEKEKLEKAKIICEIISSSSKLLLAFGALLIIAYCFLEGLHPNGLVLTDAFSFFYVIFSFAFIVFIGTAYGSYAVLWFYKLLIFTVAKIITPKSPIVLNKYITGWTTSIFSIICFLPFVTIPFISDKPVNDSYWAMLAFFAASGFTFAVFFLAESHATVTLSRNARIGIFFLMILVAMAAFKPTLLNISMEAIGMRSKSGDYIVLDQENYDRLKSTATFFKRPFSACQAPDKTWVTQDVKIVWHGIGDKTYVRLEVGAENGKQIGLLTSLNRSGVELIRDVKVGLVCDKK